MSLATVFGATAAVLGATAVVHAANVQLTVRRRRRERANRRGHRPAIGLQFDLELSRPLRALVEDATNLASRLHHARLAGDVAWAKAMVSRGDRQWSTPGAASEDAAYVAALGDAMRATSSFLARFEALPSADAELVSDRMLLCDALRRLLDERSGISTIRGLGDGSAGTSPESIDELEQALDAAIVALDRVANALAKTQRRPYR